MTIVEDITERKQAEEKLHESEARLRAILDNSPTMVFLKDTEDRYLLVNRQFERAFHVTSKDIAGKTDEEIFPPQQAAAFRANDRKVFQAGVPLRFEEVALQDDGPHTSIVFKFPLCAMDGRPYALCGITMDITDLKQAEEALRKSEEQLRKVLEEREQLSQDLHDNIIQTIYAIGMSLEECRYLLQEAPQAADKKLEHAVASLNRVISDVRNYIVWDKPEAISGQQFCAKLAELAVTMESVQGIHFSLDLAVEAAQRLTPLEAFHLLHIVQEAMSNSLRHAHSRNGLVSLQLQGGRVRLEIRDDGVGFNIEEALGRGHGLQNITARAQKLGAHLQIVSKPGSGVQILVELPLEDQHVRASS